MGHVLTMPAGMCPGHRAMAGSLMPPSNVVSFPQRKGPLLPPENTGRERERQIERRQTERKTDREGVIDRERKTDREGEIDSDGEKDRQRGRGSVY